MSGEKDGQPETYGSRCLKELRRLTNSTWGWTHAELRAIEQLDEARMLGLLGERAPSVVEDVTKGASCGPEELARRLEEEGRRRAERGGHGGPNPFDILFDLLTSL